MDISPEPQSQKNQSKVISTALILSERPNPKYQKATAFRRGFFCAKYFEKGMKKASIIDAGFKKK